MKIEKIEIKNFLSLRNITLTPNSPVVFIGGKNGSGKSAICEAVELALCGGTGRERFKKDSKNLISDGEKSGNICIELSGNISRSLKVPFSGSGEPVHTFGKYALSPGEFGRASVSNRRGLLFHGAGIKVDPEGLQALLREHACHDAVIKRIAPELFTNGFDAARIICEKQISLAKSKWKDLTGESYGHVKAKTWGQVDPSAIRDIDLKSVENALNKAKESVLKARINADKVKDASALLGSDPVDCGQLKREIAELESEIAEASANLAMDRQNLLNTTEEFDRAKAGKAQACPHCNEPLAISDDGVIKIYEALSPEETASKEESIKQEMDRLVALGDTIGEWKSQLTEMQENLLKRQRAINDCEGMTLEQAIEHFKLAQEAENKASETYAISKQAIDNHGLAVAKAENAKRFYRAEREWSRGNDALDSIESQLLAKSLHPVNEILAKMAMPRGASHVEITPEMSISMNCRAYNLLSESERWVCDAALASALAENSMGFVVLDGMDVVDPERRGSVLNWIVGLCRSKIIHGALITATLKEPPKKFPALCHGYWLKNGELTSL